MAAIPFPDEVRERVTSYIKHQGTKSPEAIIEEILEGAGRGADCRADLSTAGC